MICGTSEQFSLSDSDVAAVRGSIINCRRLVLILAPLGVFFSPPTASLCCLVCQQGNTKTTEQNFTKPGRRTDPGRGKRDQSRIFLSFIKMGVFWHFL